MRKISADYIFPVSSPPIKNGVVTIDDSGIITSLPTPLPGERGVEMEVYNGVIVPGFVNTHCHIELSHLKGQMNERKGLPGFISDIIAIRNNFSVDEIKSAVSGAEEEMIRNGIVAVGDISNTDHSFGQKKKRNLLYHTFIEVFDLDPAKAEQVFSEGVDLRNTLSGFHSSIVPHAPYTVSKQLIELINGQGEEILSIHNQETPSEDELFISGTGQMAELMKKFGVDTASKLTGKSSLHSVLNGLTKAKKIVLVHNTYTTDRDISQLTGNLKPETWNLYFATCPNANLYIENKLPDYNLFMKENLKMCIGTDSYASNWSLSVLDEMKTIATHFPHISFETLLLWATKNGAEALGFEKELGTIEKGKKPGLNLIKGMDLARIQLTDKSDVQKLV